MDITIEPAVNADLDALAGLIEQLFAIEADFHFNPKKVRCALERLLEDDRACMLVARRAGQVLGMCSAQRMISTAEGGYSVWVEDVVVDSACRGQGIGRQLLEGIRGWAKGQGAGRLQLLADKENGPALGFYQRNGWQQTQLVVQRQKTGL